MLIAYLNLNKRLCNSTSFQIIGWKQNVINAENILECNGDDIFHFNRVILVPTDISLPFVLRRHQI